MYTDGAHTYICIYTYVYSQLVCMYILPSICMFKLFFKSSVERHTGRCLHIHIYIHMYICIYAFQRYICMGNIYIYIYICVRPYEAYFICLHTYVGFFIVYPVYSSQPIYT